MTRSSDLSRRGLAALGLGLPAVFLAACADPEPAGSRNAAGGGATTDGEDGSIDTSGKQKRIRSTVDETIAATVPDDLVTAGKLTVGSLTGGTPPLVFLADDNTTTIGIEIDVAHLVADKLGLEVDLKLTSWDNWPLKLDAGDYDVVHANVGVNAERLEKYDFASYRKAFMSFLTSRESGLEFGDAASISGRTIAVGHATNQEQILLAWNEKLEKQGKKPATLKNYADAADVLLALGAGRVDAYFEPYATNAYVASTRDDLVNQGKVDAGWPVKTLVAATFPRGSGLARPYADALDALIEEGTYQQVLKRWGLAAEAVTSSRVHTKENP